MPDWFTVREAAQILGISEDSVRRRIKRGELQATKEGRFWRVLIEKDKLEPGRSGGDSQSPTNREPLDGQGAVEPITGKPRRWPTWIGNVVGVVLMGLLLTSFQYVTDMITWRSRDFGFGPSYLRIDCPGNPHEDTLEPHPLEPVVTSVTERVSYYTLSADKQEVYLGIFVAEYVPEVAQYGVSWPGAVEGALWGIELTEGVSRVTRGETQMTSVSGFPAIRGTASFTAEGARYECHFLAVNDDAMLWTVQAVFRANSTKGAQAAARILNSASIVTR